MKLKKAIEIFMQEKGAPSNAYDWYRRSAKDYGKVSVGDIGVPAYKKSGSWYIDEANFIKAIELHREKLKQIEQNTADYDHGIIHGTDGDTIITEWGGYRIYKSFRFEWSNYLIMRQKSNGMWYCKLCNKVASTKHDNEECHSCRDWNGCGKDCTLSEVYCAECKRSMKI